MQSVLTDLALESEAAVQLAMHLACCYQKDDPLSKAWQRLMTPAAKFWICKRVVELSGEAMEIFGGNGYVETGIMSRIFREAPVNSIWEGSGNVMCLDVLRAVQRDRESIEILIHSFAGTIQDEPLLQQELQQLLQLFAQSPDQLQFMARTLVSRLVILAQAVLLKKYAPDFVANAFIQTRYTAFHGRVTGLIDPHLVDMQRILERAFPA